MYLWCTQVQWRYTNICIQNHFQFWSLNFIKENCQKNVLLALFLWDKEETLVRDETKQFRWMNRQLQWWYSSSSSRIMVNEQIGKTLSSFFLFVLQGRYTSGITSFLSAFQQQLWNSIQQTPLLYLLPT